MEIEEINCGVKGKPSAASVTFNITVICDGQPSGNMTSHRKASSAGTDGVRGCLLSPFINHAPYFGTLFGSFSFFFLSSFACLSAFCLSILSLSFFPPLSPIAYLLCCDAVETFLPRSPSACRTACYSPIIPYFI